MISHSTTPQTKLLPASHRCAGPNRSAVARGAAVLYRTRRRTGITLLEIMISIGVVGVGLIGVASLIPLAHFKAEQGIRQDRMSLFGKRAHREFFVQGFDRPSSLSGFPQVPIAPVKPYWMQMIGGGDPLSVNQIYEYPPQSASVRNFGTLKNQTYCFDPLWVAARAELSSFASNQFPDTTTAPLPPVPPVMQVPRVTVRQQNLDDFYEWKYSQKLAQGTDPTQAGSSAYQETEVLFKNPRPLSLAQAAEIFRLRDDISVQDVTTIMDPTNPADEATYSVVPQPGLPNEFTQRQFLREPLGGSLVGTKQVTGGSFSWMATLVPEIAINYSVAPPLPYTTNRYQLSTVIFHQRDLSGVYREEVVAQVDYGLSMMASGVKQITIKEFATNPMIKENVGVKNIRVGDWIALMQNPVPGTPPLLPNFTRLKWYQVMAADELDLELDPPQRELTLSGPDWQVDLKLPLYAVYLRNVVAVYEKTIELQE